MGGYNVRAIRTDIHGGVMYLTILSEIAEEKGIDPTELRKAPKHDPARFPYKESITIKLWERRCDLVDRGYAEIVKEADRRFLEWDPLHDSEKILERLPEGDIRNYVRNTFEGEERINKAWGFLMWGYTDQYGDDFPKDAI